MFACRYGRVDGQHPPCISTEQQCDQVIDCLGGEDILNGNCSCGPEGTVRLVDGVVPYQGRVEYCVGGRWSTVCHGRWDTREAAVVCRQLGYPSGGIVYTVATVC